MEAANVRDTEQDLLPPVEVPSQPADVGHDGPFFGKWALAALLLWGLVVLGFAAGGLAEVTNLWWLVLVFGVAAPAALVAARGWALRRGTHAADGERELLAALRVHGELTPTSAAMVTSITIEQAAKTLERLSREGHLEAQVQYGAVTYALREADRRALSEATTSARGEAGDGMETLGMPTAPLDESLSERELTVLSLLAEGRTNREISAKLFVAQGTVKAHVAAVYRKLGVHSRAEAVSRGKDLDLIE